LIFAGIQTYSVLFCTDKPEIQLVSEICKSIELDAFSRSHLIKVKKSFCGRLSGQLTRPYFFIFSSQISRVQGVPCGQIIKLTAIIL
jgi:hypothetical protein